MKLTVKAGEVRLIEEVVKEAKSGPTRHVQTNIRTTVAGPPARSWTSGG